MLLRREWTEEGMICYGVTLFKRIIFDVNPDNSIRRVTMADWRKDCSECLEYYDIKGLYYMENLTPEDEGEIDLIDTDKLISMVCFDEGAVTC